MSKNTIVAVMNGGIGTLGAVLVLVGIAVAFGGPKEGAEVTADIVVGWVMLVWLMAYPISGIIAHLGWVSRALDAAERWRAPDGLTARERARKRHREWLNEK